MGNNSVRCMGRDCKEMIPKDGPAWCSRCAEKRKKTTVKCSLCLGIFTFDGCLDPKVKNSVNCSKCAEVMRDHLGTEDYKELHLGETQCVYPATLEDELQKLAS